MAARVKVAVFGASGYTGLELTRLLSRHPGVALVALTSREFQGQPVARAFPALAGFVDLTFTAPDPEALAAQAPFIFTAVPHQTAMDIVPRLITTGCRVVDLSADFRFQDRTVYEAWYQPHTAPELLAQAVYGLPELHRDRIREASLVGNPGCYPTCVILGFAPLLKAGLARPESLIADCKSGVSGAGRGASLATSYCEVADSFKAYKVAEHRHTPEMEQELGGLGAAPVRLTFTPHLSPMNRGILGTLYADLTKSVSEQDLFELYRDFYQIHPFIRLHTPGSLPATAQVRGSNFCDLGFKVDKKNHRAIIISAIDNLTRGAAGQAIHNFNLMAGLPETQGLDAAPFTP